VLDSGGAMVVGTMLEAFIAAMKKIAEQLRLLST
jgi:hypothetical protein